MKALKLFLLATVLFSLTNCQQESTEPEQTIEGTWQIKSIVTDFAGQSNVDVYAFLGAFFPCVYDITYTFSSGKITADDKGCVDDDGESNAIVSSSGATYVFENDILTITDGATVITGSISFNGNLAVWTSNDPTGESDQAVTTFEKK